MKIIYWILLLMATLLYYCKPKEKDKPITSQALSINQEVLDYFGIYKTGTWWTYKDTFGNMRDSSYVVEYSRIAADAGKGTSETVYCKIRSRIMPDFILNISVKPDGTNVISGKLDTVMDADCINFVVNEKGGIYSIDNTAPNWDDDAIVYAPYHGGKVYAKAINIDGFCHRYGPIDFAPKEGWITKNYFVSGNQQILFVNKSIIIN